MFILTWLIIFTGGKIENLGAIDGISMWESFLNNTKSPRKKILHNIDDLTGYAAIRDTNFKYIKGKLWYIYFHDK